MFGGGEDHGEQNRRIKGAVDAVAVAGALCESTWLAPIDLGGPVRRGGASGNGHHNDAGAQEGEADLPQGWRPQNRDKAARLFSVSPPNTLITLPIFLITAYGPGG
jgi:hypothetical protein